MKITDLKCAVIGKPGRSGKQHSRLGNAEGGIDQGADRRLYAFWKITLPLAMPAVLAVALFAFTNA